MRKMNWERLLSSARPGEPKSPQTSDSQRSRFEQDYDRIIFSHPFRSLQDKTQVFPMPEDDFVHTRLTHSLEVSSVGRSLGRAVGQKIIDKYPGLKNSGYTAYDFGAIVAAACLTHDIGNPPFGHAGESTISEFFKETEDGLFFKDKVSDAEWKDLTHFEGNAQGFRLLNDPEYRGLKCTSATLAAFTKYPRTSTSPKDDRRKSQKKYGCYQSDLEVFKQVADSCGLLPFRENSWFRHPLAFLVEAADDICYLIIDLEDGTRLGLVPFEYTRDLLASIIGERYNAKKLESVRGIDQKLGLLRALAIQQLVSDCSHIFIKNEEAMLEGNFDDALTDQLTYSDILNEISGLSVEKIYRSKQVLLREAMGLEVLNNIMRNFTHAMYHVIFNKATCTNHHKTIFRMLPGDTQSKLKANDKDVYECLQLILDFVSGMTDRSALKIHKILTGQIAVF